MQKNYVRMNWLNCVTHVIIMSLSVSRVIGKKHDMSAWNANFLGKHQFANYIFCQNKAEATYFCHGCAQGLMAVTNEEKFAEISLTTPRAPSATIQ